MTIWIPILTTLLSGLIGVVASLLTIRSQQARLRAEFGTEQSAETAIRRLLELDKYRYRSFRIIRHHIGGFEPNELRRLLVRAGAVRFIAADGTELWALRDRVEAEYQQGLGQHQEVPVNAPPPGSIFPEAFGNEKDY